MRPIKLLHLTPPRGLGGIEAYVFSHYKYMDQEKFKLSVITLNTELRNSEEYRHFQFDVKLLPDKAANAPEMFSKRVREILTESYDVLHLNTGYWTGFRIEEIAREMGVPKVIVHSHSTSVDINDPKKREALLKQHEELKKKFSVDLATDFCACSRKAADWLFGPQIPRNRIRIMKNAIEVERFQFNPEIRRKIRAELGLGNEWVLGTTGRMSYQKNHEFLIEAFKELHQKYNNTKLMIVGDGEQRKNLELQLQEYGLQNAVLLLGWKPDVENYLQAMDGYTLPSRFEGLGIAAVEAIASGLPCVVSDQVPEELSFADSVQFVPLQIPLWVSAMERMMGENLDRRNGREIIRSAGYDVRYQAKALEKLYQE